MFKIKLNLIVSTFQDVAENGTSTGKIIINLALTIKHHAYIDILILDNFKSMNFTFQILILLVFARTSHADTDSETHNQYSRDYDDLNRLKDIPNFWDLFSEYPEYSGSSDETNSQTYPQQYALPPSSSSQGYKNNLFIKIDTTNLHSENFDFNCYSSIIITNIITISQIHEITVIKSAYDQTIRDHTDGKSNNR